jgi:DNA-directed RNA polymerase subunit RPC12/RpoP
MRQMEVSWKVTERGRIPSSVRVAMNCSMDGSMTPISNHGPQPLPGDVQCPYCGNFCDPKHMEIHMDLDCGPVLCGRCGQRGTPIYKEIGDTDPASTSAMTWFECPRCHAETDAAEPRDYRCTRCDYRRVICRFADDSRIESYCSFCQQQTEFYLCPPAPERIVPCEGGAASVPAASFLGLDKEEKCPF